MVDSNLKLLVMFDVRVMVDVRGFNDSNTCWLYRLIFIVRN